MKRSAFYQYIKSVRVGIFLLLFLLLFLAVFSERSFGPRRFLKAQIVQMSLTIQPAPSIITSGVTFSPSQSQAHQFEAGSEDTFVFTNPDSSSVDIVFFAGTTQATLDFFVDAYAQSAILGDRPLPVGKDVAGSLIYDMTAFIGSIATSTFNTPFSMTFRYPEDQLGNLNEETLGIYSWDESQSIWVAFNIDSRDTEQNTITILTDHLTLFTILGEKKKPPLGNTSGVGTIPFNPVIPQEEILIRQPERKIGDINSDGKVDLFDFNLLMFYWGKIGPDHIADLNNDRLVGVLDFNLLMVQWTIEEMKN